MVESPVIYKPNGKPLTFVNNPSAKNPTYDHLMKFLCKDPIDHREWIYPDYTCYDFMQDVHNNAENAGLRAGAVILSTDTGNLEYGINVFSTTDKGLVYIDCSSGRVSGWKSFIRRVYYHIL